VVSRDDDPERAVEIVRGLLDGDRLTEAQRDVLRAELESLVPDPRVSDLIYWPGQHPRGDEARALGGDAEAVVEVAWRYRRIIL
jgi:hypothetical protein